MEGASYVLAAVNCILCVISVSEMTQVDAERTIPLASSTCLLCNLSKFIGRRKKVQSFNFENWWLELVLQRKQIWIQAKTVDILLMVDTEQTSIPFLATCIIFHIVNNKKNCWFRWSRDRRMHWSGRKPSCLTNSGKFYLFLVFFFPLDKSYKKILCNN